MKNIFLESFHTEADLLLLREEKKSDLEYCVTNIQCNPLYSTKKYTTKQKSNKSFQRGTCF